MPCAQVEIIKNTWAFFNSTTPNKKESFKNFGTPNYIKQSVAIGLS